MTDTDNELNNGDNTMETLQRLYDSEINVAIWWNWDGGVGVRLGSYDEDKNWEVSGNVPDVQAAIKWLTEKALELYPKSVFAKSERS